MLLRLVFAVELIVVALMVRQWAYVTTYRLYLDRDIGGARQSTVTQQFELQDGHVVPRLVTRKHESLAFPNSVGPNALVRAELVPDRPLRYAVAWRTTSGRQILAGGATAARVAISTRIPHGTGVLELETDAPATWLDPRLVRRMHVGPHLVALLLLMLLSRALHSRASTEDRAALRIAWFKTAALTTAGVAGVCACEVTLRALGDHAPAGVLALRHDLGENTPDERWEDSPRYGRRLRAFVDTHNDWTYGDIVRMGFIPASVSPAVRHRFAFATDAEGFRNEKVRERVSVAALGDSFTDAMTVPAGESWPSRLEQRLGAAVQNYGTAGFGPQQELLVLRDYVLRHRPARVVLAYFAGNDLFDAERFDRFERGESDAQTLGWPIKDVYSRADTWFVTSAITASAGWFSRQVEPAVVMASEEHSAEGRVAAAAPFDRGLFSLRVNGKLLQWAFMPPYLNTMNFSERELRQRPGWRLTRQAILAMRAATHEAGAEFIVMFLPFKSQVYWPLLERSLGEDDLRRALSFYLDGLGRTIDVAALRRNRLAQNAMLRDLCESAGIRFLDTTPALQRRVESGDNVYFPDESHLNELGHRIVADTLASFLSE